MRNSVIAFTGLAVLLFVSPAFANQEEAVSRPSWLPRWEKARGLEKRGSYLEAREIYELLLRRRRLGKRKRTIQKEYEALNMKIIFSKVETPESIFYEVVPGDTLYEIAKKYGTTVQLLQKSNGISGNVIYPGIKLKINQSKFSIKVEKSANRLTLLANGQSLKTYRVATGIGGSTPEGTFKIANRLEDPTWFHAGLAVPPENPENILGSRWLGFNVPGYGIHGTTLPETIGTQASKGCIRMHNSDVEELYSLVPVGTEVDVKP